MSTTERLREDAKRILGGPVNGFERSYWTGYLQALADVEKEQADA